MRIIGMSTIDSNTKISLSIAITVVVSLISACGFIYTSIASLNQKLDNITTRMEERYTALEEKIELKAADRYTLTMAAESALRNAILNPGVRFADPRRPGEYIVVEGK